MVVDTSALVAILQNEPERRVFVERLEAADSIFVSAATLVETGIVIEARYGPDGARALDLFVARSGMSVVPVDEDQARIARRASREYGKGRHRAGLNYGDCFAYACAVALGEPLLFKGDDFGHTELESAAG